HTSCQGAAPASACQCVAEPLCTQEGSFCNSGGSGIVTCTTDAATSCRYLVSNVGCPSPEVCASSDGGAACQCPALGTAVNQGCASAGATECGPGGASVNTCALVNGCLVWQQTESCTAGLVCGSASGGPGCQCPANTGSDFFADATDGMLTGAVPYP